MRRKRCYTEFGLYVAGMLAELNMTAAELAERIGVSKATVSETMTGRLNNQKTIEAIRSCLLQEERKRKEEKNAV